MKILFLIMGIHFLMETIGILIGTRRDYNKTFTSSGCNVFNNPFRETYCIEHDKAYGRGGWVLSRLKADCKLFKCICKNNIIVAIIVFLGVRLFGMFEFEYGKKRKLRYEDGSTD